MTAVGAADVPARFDALIGDALAQASPLGYFPCLYRAVTATVLDGVARGQFDDGPRMARFVGCFAGLFFDAWDAWRGGGAPPRAWRCAFEEARTGNLLVVQDLLLGMNAHINLDLGHAAATVAGDAAGLDALHADFLRIDAVLAALTGPVQAVLEQHSPMLGVVDEVAGSADADAFGFSLERARDDAWLNAQLLVALPDALRGPTIDLVDRKTAWFGRLIAHPAEPLAHAITVAKAAETTDVRAMITALSAVRA